ncbi:uncharacterized protein ACBT44_007539 isoform 3-T7 [Syngnathus typhle]
MQDKSNAGGMRIIIWREITYSSQCTIADDKRFMMKTKVVLMESKKMVRLPGVGFNHRVGSSQASAEAAGASCGKSRSAKLFSRSTAPLGRSSRSTSHLNRLKAAASIGRD